MTINERFAEILKSKNISIKEAAEILSKSEGYVRKLLIPNQSFGIEPVKSILNSIKDVNIEWLLTGDGSMLKNSKVISKENSKDNAPIQQNLHDPTVEIGFVSSGLSIHQLKNDYFGVDQQPIPLYEIEASAGLNTLFSSQITQVPLDYINVPNAPKCDGALFIRGDSMYPLLKAGDIVCYKTIYNIENVRFGEMYLLDIDDGDDNYLTVKYVQKSDRGDDYFKLVSQNPHHDPKDEHVSHIKSLALVKLSIRYNTIS